MPELAGAQAEAVRRFYEYAAMFAGMNQEGGGETPAQTTTLPTTPRPKLRPEDAPQMPGVEPVANGGQPGPALQAYLATTAGETLNTSSRLLGAPVPMVKPSVFIDRDKEQPALLGRGPIPAMVQREDGMLVQNPVHVAFMRDKAAREAQERQDFVDDIDAGSAKAWSSISNGVARREAEDNAAEQQRAYDAARSNAEFEALAAQRTPRMRRGPKVGRVL